MELGGPPQVATSDEDDDVRGRPSTLRRKGHIAPRTLAVLTLLATLPLGLGLARILALPAGGAIDAFGLGSLRRFGVWLNQNITLDWVPPGDRQAILYLLVLPTATLLVAFTRLTLGVRVLGLRAIMIAVAFRAIGILPSLVLILLVIGVIILIRPWFQRIQLPLLARIGVIVCLSSIVMVGALVIAPWFDSQAAWSVAFFPVIIIAMLAESVARTMERDDVVMATWRTGGTILLAVVVSFVGAPAARITYQFPELILTQLVAIIFIAEFLDLRLFEAWPARLSRLLAGTRPWFTPKPKVAVVRNREPGRVINWLGPRAPAEHASTSVQRQVDALRDEGFEVRVFEGDIGLFTDLQEWMPPDPRTRRPGGIVFNLATSVQGASRFCHVPAMLELAGVPYTGPDPLGHAHIADRYALMTLLGRAQVPVPRHVLVVDTAAVVDIEFPAAARPRFEPDASRIVLRNRDGLRRAVQSIRTSYGQPALVEQIVLGRKLSVFVVGNVALECLPVLEHGGNGKERTQVAALGAPLLEQVLACARAAFRAAHCRDYARIDVRLTERNEPIVIDVRWLFSFARGDAFDRAAQAAGYSLGTLLRRFVNEAAARHGATATWRAALVEAAPAPAQPVVTP